MVAGKDDRTVQRDSLGVAKAAAKIRGEDQSKERPTDPVAEVHPKFSSKIRDRAATVRRPRYLFSCILSFRFTSAMIIALVSSEVMVELLMTVAPSGIISGAAARWLSR